MDWFEQMAITVVLGILQQIVKNPAKQAAMRSLLLSLADTIDETYGLVPPTHT